MRLYDNWREILKKSWCIFFLGVAALGQTALIVLPLYADEIPRGEYAIMTLVAIVAAGISRLIYQKDI